MIPFCLPKLASLLPAFTAKISSQDSNANSTRQMGTALAKPIPATPQAGKKPDCKKSRVMAVQGRGFGDMPLAVFLQHNLGSPPQPVRSDVYTWASPHRVQSEPYLILPPKVPYQKLLILRHRWHHNYLIAQAKNPRVTHDFFGSSPQTPCWFSLPIHPLVLHCHHPRRPPSPLT